MSKILIQISSIAQLINIKSLFDSGIIKADEKHLLVADTTRRPEVNSNLFTGIKQNSELVKEFNRIIFFNDIIYPFHPSQLKFEPNNEDHFGWLKKLIGEEYYQRILVESIQVAPASFLADIYSEAAIDIHADGLMVYSPTRNDLSQTILSRIEHVFYVDYLRGIKPLLLMEADPQYIAIPKKFITSVINKFRHKNSMDKKNIVIVGQYLADINIYLPADEIKFYANILKYEYEKNGSEFRYIFRPHPQSISAYNNSLIDFASENSIPLYIDDSILPMEFTYSDENTYKVCGLFSTSLFSMSYLYNINCQSYFCDEIYPQLYPLQNSNHIPVMLSKIFYDINYEKQLISDKEILFSIIIYSYAAFPKRFRDLYYDIDPIILLNKLIDKTNIFTFDFIKKLQKEINKVQKQQEQALNQNNLRLQNKTFKELRAKAEEAISKKDYSAARQYFIAALVIRPGNTKCIIRLRAVTSHYLIRPILLRLTRKHKIV